MRQLLPRPMDHVDPVTAHAAADRPPPAGRPWVMVNMVASADGATAVDGLSGSLGGDADRAVFSAIRAVADVVVAAAGTVRAEGYGPPRTSEENQRARVARGQEPLPRLAVVSRSLDLDPRSAMFTGGSQRPLVFTCETADPGRLDRLSSVAEVVVCSGTSVAPGEILAHLHGSGAQVVLVEGGPSLNGAFLGADLVDELDLTTSPALVGGGSARLVSGAPERVLPLSLAHLWEHEGVLLARYVRARVRSDR
ncbi:MAG: dihydrofolate reductase family protein [Acidimicrobiales bacterium]|nr:dihydrofolate reductase family protein [Acidimicrobiales bacterium]